MPHWNWHAVGWQRVAVANEATYVLTRGREPIALLWEVERDQPWVVCEFRALPAFEAVRPVLEAVRREDTFRSALRYRLLRLRLRSADGYPTIRRLWLVVEGDRASFRCSLGRVGRWKLRRWGRRQALREGG